MISSSPTQQPPTPSDPPDLKQPETKTSSSRRRPGESREALFIKSILRPIIKGFYYLLRAIQGHKLLTVLAIILLLASTSITTYLTTGQLPFGIASDPFNFHIRGGNGGGDQVKNWLTALRDGDATKLALDQSGLIMSQPPDPNQLVGQYSQPQAHLTWQAINVAGVYSQADTTVDSFVSVDFVGPGPGGNTKGIMVWHFVTLPSDGGRLLIVDLVSFRPSE